MFGLSGSHLIIIVVILLIFGPRKLPELGNTLGKAIKNFKDSLDGVQNAKFRNLDESGTPGHGPESKTVHQPEAPVPAAPPITGHGPESKTTATLDEEETDIDSNVPPTKKS